jgi:hypothetical protein
MHGIATQAQSRSHDCFFPRRHFVDSRLISSRLIFARVTVEVFFLDIYGFFRYVLVWFCDRRRVFVARRLFSILRWDLCFRRDGGAFVYLFFLTSLALGVCLASRGPLADFRGRLAGWGHTPVWTLTSTLGLWGLWALRRGAEDLQICISPLCAAAPVMPPTLSFFERFERFVSGSLFHPEMHKANFLLAVDIAHIPSHPSCL